MNWCVLSSLTFLDFCLESLARSELGTGAVQVGLRFVPVILGLLSHESVSRCFYPKSRVSLEDGISKPNHFGMGDCVFNIYVMQRGPPVPEMLTKRLSGMPTENNGDSEVRYHGDTAVVSLLYVNTTRSESSAFQLAFVNRSFNGLIN